jgi:patatin-like phospholipase/acyl hydrolase
LIVASYDYNSRRPKFFSKYMNWANQGEYNAQVKEAVGASSAMPMFFDPLRFINGFGIEE